ncbi:MAG: 50S ribosomal protein L5 [bacterium]
MTKGLKERYNESIAPALMAELGIENQFAVPQIKKIVINIGIKKSDSSAKDLEVALTELTAIAGQKPSVRNAKKSIAGFKIRAGEPVGIAVTLRGQRMFDFLDKLCRIVLPQVKDFRGVSRSSFDGSGNYTLGLTEQVIFQEIDYSKVDKVRGLEICIVTTTKSNEHSFKLLELIGMPFAKEEKE